MVLKGVWDFGFVFVFFFTFLYLMPNTRIKPRGKTQMSLKIQMCGVR